MIIERLYALLIRTYDSYLKTDERNCLATLENLHSKYAVTAKAIEAKRDVHAAKMKAFLMELGYE